VSRADEIPYPPEQNPAASGSSAGSRTQQISLPYGFTDLDAGEVKKVSAFFDFQVSLVSGCHNGTIGQSKRHRNINPVFRLL
jgi:hypothetical protein